MNTQTKQTKHTQWWIDPINPGIVRFNCDPTCGILAGTNAALIIRAVNSHQELLEAATLAQCDCSPRERDSGHKSGCWFPALQAAIAKARGEE